MSVKSSPFVLWLHEIRKPLRETTPYWTFFTVVSLNFSCSFIDASAGRVWRVNMQMTRQACNDTNLALKRLKELFILAVSFY